MVLGQSRQQQRQPPRHVDDDLRDPVISDATLGQSISAEDTLNEVHLHFATLDEAVAFAKKRGLDYVVAEPQESVFKHKSYADNFRYDKPRRV